MTQIDLAQSPPCHKDPVYDELSKIARSPRRATQMLPQYREFRVGHGDPLMRAALRNNLRVARIPPPLPFSSSEHEEDDQEVHLLESGSPLGGLGFNDVVHIDKDTLVSFPCLLTRSTSESSGKKDNLQEHGLSLAGLGMNDVVHIGDEIWSIPCLPVRDA